MILKHITWDSHGLTLVYKQQGVHTVGYVFVSKLFGARKNHLCFVQIHPLQSLVTSG